MFDPPDFQGVPRNFILETVLRLSGFSGHSSKNGAPTDVTNIRCNFACSRSDMQHDQSD